MKSIINPRIILCFIGLLFLFSFFLACGDSDNKNKTNTYSGYCEDFTVYEPQFSISGVSGRIHVNDNWTVAKAAGICTGNGTFSEPYIIKDLIINGGGIGSCILIENSEEYFEIENCTLYNSSEHPDATIRLKNITRGKLIMNNCTSGNFYGIYLSNCYNITISGNNVNKNNYYGIRLSDCHDISLSENVMNECSLSISGTLDHLKSYEISASNLVNGKPLYYYKNEVNLNPDSFLNAGQVILVNCNDSLLNNLDISFCDTAISLYYCNNCTISGNIANNNNCGLELNSCVGNIISGNVVNYNHNYGIKLLDCLNNTISGNMVYNNTYYGINLIACDNNTISGNTVSNNNVWGIFFTSYEDNDILGNALCVGNIILGNIVNDNQYGITLWHCHNDTISGNIVSNSNGWGIFIVWCYDIVVRGNIASYNKYGIFLDIVYANTIVGNIANDNSEYGINVYYSDLNIILGNIANNNGKAGIYSESSDRNIISENTANNNLFYGIQLLESDYNTIQGNTLLGNAECIHEENCHGNKFNDNGECAYGQNEPLIPGYSAIILLAVISIVTFILGKKVKHSQN